jgi:hypothetical protein
MEIYIDRLKELRLKHLDMIEQHIKDIRTIDGIINNNNIDTVQIKNNYIDMISVFFIIAITLSSIVVPL